jgi:hypothetical protein
LTGIEHLRFGGVGRIKNKKEGEGKILSRFLNVIEKERKETGVESLCHNEGSELQVKIGKYIQRWKDLDRGEYFEFLAKLQVQACKNHPEAHLYTDDGPKFPLFLTSPHAKKNKRAAARPFYRFSGLSEDEKSPPSTLNFNQYQDKEETHSDEESAATETRGSEANSSFEDGRQHEHEGSVAFKQW